jgi:hypothetical protein
MTKNFSVEQLEYDEKWYKQRHYQIRKKQGWKDKTIQEEWENLKTKDISIDKL